MNIFICSPFNTVMKTQNTYMQPQPTMVTPDQDDRGTGVYCINSK